MASSIAREEYAGEAWLLRHRYPSLTEQGAAYYAARKVQAQYARGRRVNKARTVSLRDVVRRADAHARDVSELARELLGADVARMLASGSTQRECAEMLGISESTLSERVKSAREKISRMIRSF